LPALGLPDARGVGPLGPASSAPLVNSSRALVNALLHCPGHDLLVNARPAMSTASASPFARFRHRFCQHYAVAEEHYIDAALRHTLPPVARFLRPILLAFDSDYFAADRDFLDHVGQLSRRRDFPAAVYHFRHHPQNTGVLRTQLRLRCSVHRARALVDLVLGLPANVSAPVPLGPQTGER
jgi:hypothetical protein